MREQTVTPRAGRGKAARGRPGDILNVQQPTPRRGAAGKAKHPAKSAGRSGRARWRKLIAWLPALTKLALAAVAVLFLFKGYRAASASEFFGLKSVDVSGAARASEEQIKQIVRRSAAGGVWQADLDAISAELERQPWVRSAVVARVLPSGLRVRVTERQPRAVVRTNGGRFVWVDEDAVMLGQLAAAHEQPAFFMRGWDESGADAARAANRQRVEKFLALVSEWESASLSARVSEVNLDDLRDVRAQLSGDDSEIEVRLGGDELTKRLRQALAALDEQRQTPRGAHITYIDMTQSKRAVLGYRAAAQRQGDGDNAAAVDAQSAAFSNAAAGAATRATGETTVGAATKKPARQPARANAPPKRAARDEATTEGAPARPRDGSERPRRAGGEGRE